MIRIKIFFIFFYCDCVWWWLYVSPITNRIHKRHVNIGKQKKKHIIKIEKKSVTSSQKQSEWYENVDYVSTHIHTHIVSSCSFNMRNKIQNPCAMENKWKNNNNKISEKK